MLTIVSLKVDKLSREPSANTGTGGFHSKIAIREKLSGNVAPDYGLRSLTISGGGTRGSGVATSFIDEKQRVSGASFIQTSEYCMFIVTYDSNKV